MSKLTTIALRKMASAYTDTLGGVVGGAGLGAWLDRRNRLRGLLIGGLVGGVVTNTGKALYDLSRL